MKNLASRTLTRTSTRLALLLTLPAVFGVARCNTPFDRPASDEVSTVAIYPEHDAKRWTIDEFGLGPLRAGLAIPEVGRFLPGAISIPAGEETNPCSYADWPDAPAGVYVMIEGGVISRIEVDSATVATAAGARVGDTEARIDSLYPGRVERQIHKFSDGRYLVVRAPSTDEGADDYRIVFETDGERVTRFRSGRYPAVAYVDACDAGA